MSLLPCSSWVALHLEPQITTAIPKWLMKSQPDAPSASQLAGFLASFSFFLMWLCSCNRIYQHRSLVRACLLSSALVSHSVSQLQTKMIKNAVSAVVAGGDSLAYLIFLIPIKHHSQAEPIDQRRSRLAGFFTIYIGKCIVAGHLISVHSRRQQDGPLLFSMSH